MDRHGVRDREVAGQVVKQQERVPWQRVAEIGAQVADALAHAHDAGVVHRGLKPDNVLVTERRVALTDFGIARILDASTQLTHTGTVIGTPQYMAPEQLEGRPVEAAADLWSLGATLYTAVTGQPPFGGTTLTAIYTAILTRPVPPAPQAGALEPVLRALLDKDAARRPTATEAAELLDRLRRTEPATLALPVREAPTEAAAVTPTAVEPPVEASPAAAPTAVPSPTATAPPTDVADTVTQVLAATPTTVDAPPARVCWTGGGSFSADWPG